MKVSVNIPSYRRAEGVDTLRFLPWARVWVCETEAGAYRAANPGAEIVAVPKGVQGNKSRVCNFILETEWDRGVDAVCLMDDDISHFAYWEKGRCHRLLARDFEEWLVKYSLLADELGARLWGVNVNRDKQVYKENVPFSMLSFIGGPFTVHLPNPLRYDESMVPKEDYDMVLQHLNRFRRVLRLNKFHYSAKMGCSGTGQTGGCAVLRNRITEIERLQALQRKWGSKIVKIDKGERNHASRKKRRALDCNPVIRVPIKGV